VKLIKVQVQVHIIITQKVYFHSFSESNVEEKEIKQSNFWKRIRCENSKIARESKDIAEKIRTRIEEKSPGSRQSPKDSTESSETSPTFINSCQSERSDHQFPGNNDVAQSRVHHSPRFSYTLEKISERYVKKFQVNSCAYRAKVKRRVRIGCGQATPIYLFTR
jgi:hypothetical protein